MARANESVSSAQIQRSVMQAAEALLGCRLIKEPGRGRGETYRTPDGKVVSLRSSRDGDLLYQPVKGGTSFKTLDDVDQVFLGTYDDVDNPTAIEIYCFDSKILLDRYREAYAYRRAKGVIPSDDVGMGISLRAFDSDAPSRSHSGVLELGRCFSKRPLNEVAALESRTEHTRPRRDSCALTPFPQGQPVTTAIEADTVAAALADCRARIARLIGLPAEAVTLSLNIQS